MERKRQRKEGEVNMNQPFVAGCPRSSGPPPLDQFCSLPAGLPGTEHARRREGGAHERERREIEEHAVVEDLFTRSGEGRPAQRRGGGERPHQQRRTSWIRRGGGGRAGMGGGGAI